MQDACAHVTCYEKTFLAAVKRVCPAMTKKLRQSGSFPLTDAETGA
jgi:hypothetical protein